MVSKAAVRVGVLLVVVLGALTMASGFAAASDHCEETEEEWPSECPGEGDEDPVYDGPNPDLLGNVTDAIDQLLNPAELQSR